MQAVLRASTRVAASFRSCRASPLVPLPGGTWRLAQLVPRTASADVSISTSTTPPEPEAKPEAAMPAADAAPKKDDVQGDMLKPSVVNTPWARGLAMIAAVGVAAGSSTVLPAQAVAFIHVVSYGLWLGTIIFNTFVVGLTLFKQVPRQTFGRIQSVLFPKYFTLTTVCNGVLLGTLVLGSTAASAAVVPGAATTLGVALVASLGNALVLEPKATKLMFARYDLENKAVKTEEDKTQIAKLYSAFGKYHGMSSLLNLVITCAALGYGYSLAGLITL